MTEPIKLSNTGRAMLMLAATREDRLVPPPTLPVAAARQVVRSLINSGLIEEVPAPEDAAYFWREGDDGAHLALRATDAGLAAVNAVSEAPSEPEAVEAFTRAVIGFLAEEGCNATVLEEDEARIMIADGYANARPAAGVAGDILAWLAEEEAEVMNALEIANRDAVDAEVTVHQPIEPDANAEEDAREQTAAAPVRRGLRQAAEAVLAVWNDETSRATDTIAALNAPMAALRAALGSRTSRATPTTTARQPREGTKQSKVLEMLRRPEGVTVAQISEAMGWAPHTVRGFFAGLKKRQGIIVAPAERVRQAGPEGAKGSYTIYRIAEAI